MSIPDSEEHRLLQLNPTDNVCAATRAIHAGEELGFNGRRIRVREEIAVGHKVAVVGIPQGSKVRKYGANIGTASQDIAPGDHVHLHNLRSDYLPTRSRGELGSGEKESGEGRS